jgi:pilus assembly protein TadC
MILGAITLFLMFVFRFRLEREMIYKFKYSFLISLMALFGFLSTVVAGRSVSGYNVEWTREFLPVTLLFTWGFFSFIVLIYEYFRLGKVDRN